MSNPPDDLNPSQRAAIEHRGGPLLIVAGPGSGKTRVITRRIVHRIQSGDVAAEQILGVTFTHRAAAEMQARVRELLGTDVRPRLGTFHWMCHAILRRYIDRLGYARDFHLLSPAESHAVLRRVLRSLPAVEFRRVSAGVSATKNGLDVEVAAKCHGVEVAALAAACGAYHDALRLTGALDLDDLLRLSVALLREDETTRNRCRSVYQEILVDEYQDTNPVQQELLRLLTPAGRAVVAVGDEDQAIYGWRQAGTGGMRRFVEDFPDAAIIRLERSYRSTKRILRAAGALVRNNPSRLGAPLHTDNAAGEPVVCYVADDEVEEAEWIAAEIERLVQRGNADVEHVGVLYRVNAQSRALEDALVRHGLPYHVHAGQRFYERPEVRRAIAYLQLALEADDGAAEYLAGCIPGIGLRRITRLRETALEERSSLLELFRSPPTYIPRDVAARLQAIERQVAALRAQRDQPLSAIVSSAISLSGEWLDDSGPLEQEVALENLGELHSVIRELDARASTLRDLTDRLSLGSSAADRRGVTLMTLHAAKGLEFPVVFIAGLEEGLLPHRRSVNTEDEVAEERRLCYVGMTRARTLLYLSYAHARLIGGHAMLGQESRFVSEIGSSNLSLRLSPRRAAKPRLTSVRVGERVTHPRWNDGTVADVEGTGRGTLVTIDFDEIGRQRLQLCHAPLRRLEPSTMNVLAG